MPLHGIRHLPLEQSVKPFVRHAGAFENAGSLKMPGRRNHDDRIHLCIQLRFEEQGDFQYGHLVAPGSRGPEEILLPLRTSGCTIFSRMRKRSALLASTAARRALSTRPSAVVPGNAASILETASPA